LIRCALPALLLAASQAGAVTMYKCVDAKGVTHYSEQPVAGCKGREVDIRPVPPPSGTQTQPGDINDSEREFRKRQIERGRKEEAEAAEAKKRAQRCAAAKNELERLGLIRRPYAINAKGEREFLDEAAIAARNAKQQEEVRKACG
jgi:hypothetical protein